MKQTCIEVQCANAQQPWLTETIDPRDPFTHPGLAESPQKVFLTTPKGLQHQTLRFVAVMVALTVHDEAGRQLVRLLL
jgi:hypothetical protein